MTKRYICDRCDWRDVVRIANVETTEIATNIIESSDGRTKPRRAKAGNKTGSIPVEAGYPTATRLGRGEVREAAKQPIAGVSPRPSEAKLKRGRPFIIGPRPWELQGISRRTYYRNMERERARRQKGTSK